MFIDSVFDLLDALAFWRFFLALAVGIGAGLAVYYAAGQDPASAAIAFGLGFCGLCVGFVWQISSGRLR